MCQNYKTGCREMKQTINELEFHQQKCIFRRVFCPDLACSKESRNIMFKDVMKHINDSHGNVREIKMLRGQKNIWRVKISNRQDLDDKLSWSGTMTSTSGDVFFFQAKISNNYFHCWVNFLGSSGDAKNFNVNLSVDKSVNFCETFIYNGPVHILEKEPSDIIEEQICFSIKMNAVRRCLTNFNRLNIMITIKNINDQMEGEDHGESDDSEKKPTAKKRRRSMRS